MSDTPPEGDVSAADHPYFDLTKQQREQAERVRDGEEK